MTVEITTPYSTFFDIDGTALEAGKIYIGSNTLDPETNLVVVYWDRDLTVTAAQPIRTIAGIPDNGGTPSNVYTAEVYSITVRDKNDVLIYSKLDDGGVGSNVTSATDQRNRIINGNFDIWQRGTSQTASGYGSADRWKLTLGASAACTVSRATHMIGQTDVPGNPKYYLDWARATPGTTSSLLDQRIEDVKAFSNEVVTITFYAKSTLDTEITSNFKQHFGTSGSPSADVDGTAKTYNITTAWQKFTYSETVASISGKTLGTDGNDYLSLVFSRDEISSNPTATVSVSRVSVVRGDATADSDPFNERSIGEELALCQRYYEKSYNIDVDPSTITEVGRTATRAVLTSTVDLVTFATSKRDTPTIAMISPVTGTVGNVRNYSTSADISTVTVTSPGHRCFQYNITVTDGGNGYGGHWTADSEL